MKNWITRLVAVGTGHVVLRPRGWSLLWLAAAAMILAVLFYSSTWRTGDDGRYFILGISIAEGTGLAESYNPLRPPETLTPPLYPALIAGVIRVTENPVVWVKRMGSGLYVLAVLVVALVLIQQDRSSWAGWLGACMGMFAVGVAAFATHVMADTLFTLLVFLCLWMSQSKHTGPWHAVLVGCGCGLAYLTRVAAIPLIAAVLLHYLLKRQWRSLLLAALGSALVIAPWWYWKAVILQLPDPYLMALESQAASRHGMSLWSNLPKVIAMELGRGVPAMLFRQIPIHFFYAAEKVAGSAGFWRATASVVGMASTVGLFLRWRRWNAVDFYFVLTVLMLAAMPGPLGMNYYLFPVLPIAAFYFFDFAAGLARWTQARLHSRRAVLLIHVAALGVFAFSLTLDFAAGTVHFLKETPRRPHAPWASERYFAFGIDYYDAWARVSDAATWIKEHAPEDALVLSRKPDHVFIMSGRQGWRYDIPSQVERATVMEAIERFSNTRPVLLLEDAFPSVAGTWAYGNNREAVMNSTVRKYPDRWRLLYATEEPVTRVWMVEDSP